MHTDTLCSSLGERKLMLLPLKAHMLNAPEVRGCQEGGLLVAYEGETITGRRDRFVLWRNTKWKKRRVLALVARLLTYEVNVQIGPAVDRLASAERGKIKVINPPRGPDELVGLYIAASNLNLFQWIDWKKISGFTFPRHVRSEWEVRCPNA